jgi:hypothetical protein
MKEITVSLECREDRRDKNIQKMYWGHVDENGHFEVWEWKKIAL